MINYYTTLPLQRKQFSFLKLYFFRYHFIIMRKKRPVDSTTIPQALIDFTNILLVLPPFVPQTRKVLPSASEYPSLFHVHTYGAF